jgi:3-keto-5-aminohexanoate cleavage enzyme
MSKHIAGLPLIIEASLNGATSKKQNPNVPYSDEEIVSDAIACMEAGAALIHNHTEEPIIGGTGVLDAERYASAWRKLLALRPDAILTPTMPVGQEGVSDCVTPAPLTYPFWMRTVFLQTVPTSTATTCGILDIM